MNTFRLTDEDRARHRAEQAQARSLATLLPAQPAAAPATDAPASDPPQRPVSLVQLLLSAAAILAIAAIVVYVVFRPSPATNDERRTTTPGPAVAGSQPASQATPAAPTEGATIAAYAAPNGALLGPIPADMVATYRHSDYPGWAGVNWQGKVVWTRRPAPDTLPDLAKPTPAPTVERVYVEVPVEPACDQETNPRYTAQQDVYATDGRPLGQVVGKSCESQEAAQQNANDLANTMKGATP